MTSFGPIDIPDDQWAALEASGSVTPEQSAQRQAQRQQLVDLSNGAAPGFGTGQALRGIADKAGALASAPFNPGAVAAAFPGAIDAGMNAVEGIGRTVRNGVAGVLDAPGLASPAPQTFSDAAARRLAPPGIAAPDPNAPPAAVPSQLQQPQVAYGGRAPSGGGYAGGGLSGIANDIKREGQAAAADTRSAIEAQGRNYESVGRAINETADVAAAGAAQKAEAYQAALDDQKVQDGLAAQHLAEQQAAIGEQYKKATDADAMVAKMAVDPNRLYAKNGTAGKVGAAIAIALGALGASLTKGPNYALDIINKAIDDDIDAQKTNIANARANAGSQHAALREMRDMVGDDVQFANIMRGQHLDQVARQMDAYDMSNKPAEIQAQAAQQRALLQKEMDDNKAATVERAHQLAAANLGQQAQVRGQAASLALQGREADARLAAANAKTAKLPESVRAQLAKLDTAEANLAQIDHNKPSSAAALFSKIAPWDTDADKYDRGARENITDVRKATTNEATNEADKRQIEEDRPKSTDSAATVKAKLDFQRQKIIAARNALYRENGLEPPMGSDTASRAAGL